MTTCASTGPRTPRCPAGEIRQLGYQVSSSLLPRYINQGRADGNRPHLSPRRTPHTLLEPFTILRSLGEAKDEARRLKALAAENARLKRTVAGQVLDIWRRDWSPPASGLPRLPAGGLSRNGLGM